MKRAWSSSECVSGGREYGQFVGGSAGREEAIRGPTGADGAQQGHGARQSRVGKSHKPLNSSQLLSTCTTEHTELEEEQR